MFKVIGACLTIFASGALGFCYCDDFKEKQQTLKNLLHMMEYISNRILVECDCLADAFLHTAKRMEEPYGIFLEQVAKRMMGEEGMTLNQIWQEEAVSLENTLGREELDVFKECMGQTGFHDKKQQTGYIQEYARYLEEKIEEMERTKAEKCKIYKTLGIMAGFLFVIVLW